jgi:hypothetical protein
LVDQYTATLFESKPAERVLVADTLKKAIGYLADYAKLTPEETLYAEGDSKVDLILKDRTSLINDESDAELGSNRTEPRVEQIISGSVPTLSAWPGAGDIIYGFFNGIINVFPVNSLPQLCRGNITTTY